MLRKGVNKQRASEQGFTLVELLVAMTVLSFMLVIVVVGFINVVHLHNEAIASNMAQDNARTVIDELVRAVRDSTGVVGPPGPGPLGTVCLGSHTGQSRIYYIVPYPPPATGGVLYRADDCTTRTNPQALTSTSVSVSNFVVTVQSTGPKVVKPVVQVTVTVGSNNGTTAGGGAALTCGNTNSSRTFCSTVTLTSGTVPR